MCQVAAGATVLAAPNLAIAQPMKAKILQATATDLLSWAPSFIAESQGYYRDEGIEIERIPNGSGPAGLTALVSGSGTSLLSPPGEMLVAATRGMKFKILAAQSSYQALHLVLSKEYAEKHGVTDSMPSRQRIEVARGFKGIRCAVTAAGSSTDFAAQAALKGIGLRNGVDASVIPLGSVANAIAGMRNGSVDAFVAASPAPETAKHQFGSVMFFSVGRDEFPGFRALAGQLVLARASDVERSPNLYAALVRADTRAFRQIIQDPKGMGSILHSTRYKALDKDVWTDVWEGNAGQFVTPYVSRASVEAYISVGLVPPLTDPKAVNLDGVIDMRFVDQAVQQLGWADVPK